MIKFIIKYIKTIQITWKKEFEMYFNARVDNQAFNIDNDNIISLNFSNYNKILFYYNSNTNSIFFNKISKFFLKEEYKLKILKSFNFKNG